MKSKPVLKRSARKRKGQENQLTFDEFYSRALSMLKKKDGRRVKVSAKSRKLSSGSTISDLILGKK